ncbi:hypothetical protein Mapa_008100 [Marchantia paleacea]|nr:hypothetical protein Mapa_008100 [Marchantia paleacea]
MLVAVEESDLLRDSGQALAQALLQIVAPRLAGLANQIVDDVGVNHLEGDAVPRRRQFGHLLGSPVRQGHALRVHQIEGLRPIRYRVLLPSFGILISPAGIRLHKMHVQIAFVYVVRMSSIARHRIHVHVVPSIRKNSVQSHGMALEPARRPPDGPFLHEERDAQLLGRLRAVAQAIPRGYQRPQISGPCFLLQLRRLLLLLIETHQR